MAQLTFRYRVFHLLSRLPGARRPLVWLRRKGLLHLRRGFAGVFRSIAPASWSRLGAPKSNISLYEKLSVGDPTVEGGIVLHRQELTPFGPESLSVRCGVKTDIYQPFPIIWSHHRNVRLVSTTLALVLPQKKLVLESIYGARSAWADPGNQYVLLPRPTRLAGNYTSIVSCWVPNTGVPNFSHWLLDALPRLALLDRFPSDTTILVPGTLASYQIESLKMLGLGDRFRRTPERHLEVESYYLSSPPSMIVCESAYSINFLRRSFLPKASSDYKGPRRFVIHRAGMTRGIQNQEEVYDFFKDLGWGIVDTAKLTFADEIKLFQDAEAFCGDIGSGFTNAVWASPGCAVIQFVSTLVMDGSTEWICARNHLRWRYLFFPGDAAQNIRVDLREVKKVLKELGLL